MAFTEKDMLRQQEMFQELKNTFEQLKKEQKKVQEHYGFSDELISMSIDELSIEDQKMIKLLEAEAIRQSQEPKITAATASRASVSSVRRNSMRV